MRNSLCLWLLLASACFGSPLDERAGAPMTKPYETSSSAVCRDVAGTGIVSYGQQWFSSSSEQWRKNGVALDRIAAEAGERFSSRPVEGSLQVEAETVRHGVLGPMRDRLYTYTAELTFTPLEQQPGRTTTKTETIAMRCRSLGGHADEISTFGPAVDDRNFDVSIRAEDVSYSIRRILAAYPTEVVEGDLARFHAPDPWDPPLPEGWLRKVRKPGEAPAPGTVAPTPHITFDAIELSVADSRQPWYGGMPFELEIPFRGGHPATFAQVEAALDAGDRDTCILTMARTDRSAPSQTIPAHSSTLCRAGGEWDLDGDLDPRIYYVDLMACDYGGPRVEVRCLKDMTPEELSQTFGGKIRITAD